VFPFEGGAPFRYGPHGGSPSGNTLHVKGGEEEEAPPSHNIWVGNVSGETTEPMLMEAFAKFGEIDSVAVLSKPCIMEIPRGDSLRQAF